MELINIGITDVILQDYEDGQGKIIISDFNFDYNFSHYWGAMGDNTNLKKFICKINADYFAGKLVGHIQKPIDVKATFANLRREIREFMPWYVNVDFQKEMREALNDYQRSVYSQECFVNGWDNFVSNLWFSDCDHWNYDKHEVKSFFEGYCEHWNLIVTKEPKEYQWCIGIHKELKKIFKSEVNNANH